MTQELNPSILNKFTGDLIRRWFNTPLMKLLLEDKVLVQDIASLSLEPSFTDLLTQRLNTLTQMFSGNANVEFLGLVNSSNSAIALFVNNETGIVSIHYLDNNYYRLYCNPMEDLSKLTIVVTNKHTGIYSCLNHLNIGLIFERSKEATARTYSTILSNLTCNCLLKNNDERDYYSNTFEGGTAVFKWESYTDNSNCLIEVTVDDETLIPTINFELLLENSNNGVLETVSVNEKGKTLNEVLDKILYINEQRYYRPF